MLEQLIGKGRDVQVFDPHIRLDAIYGSNRNFILETIPHIGRLLTGSLDEILAWADHLVLVQKQSAEAMRQIQASGIPVLGLGERLFAIGAAQLARCSTRRKLILPIFVFRLYVPGRVAVLLASEFLLIYTCYVAATFAFLRPDAEMFLLDDNGWLRILIVTLCLIVGIYFHDLYSDIRLGLRDLQRAGVIAAVAFLPKLCSVT